MTLYDTHLEAKHLVEIGKIDAKLIELIELIELNCILYNVQLNITIYDSIFWTNIIVPTCQMNCSLCVYFYFFFAKRTSSKIHVHKECCSRELIAKKKVLLKPNYLFKAKFIDIVGDRFNAFDRNSLMFKQFARCLAKQRPIVKFLSASD